MRTPLPTSASAGPSWSTRCLPRASPATCLGRRAPASHGTTPAARGRAAADPSSSCSSQAQRPPRYPAARPHPARPLHHPHCAHHPPPPAGPAVLGPLRPVPHQPPAGRPDTARGAVDSAGRVQVAQEALSPQLPRLRRGLLPPRHHRPGAAAAECGEAATHGAGAGGPEAGGAAAAAAPAGARGGAEPAAAQPSFLRKHVLAAVEAQTPDQHCDWSPWPGTKWCWQLSSWTLWDAWAAEPSSVDRRDKGAQLQVFLGGHSMPPCRTLG